MGTEKPKEELKWVDATSYQQGDTVRKPTAWELVHNGMRVAVVFNHVYHPGEYVFHCREFNFDTQRLPGVTTEAQAKAEAIRYMLIRAKVLVKTLEEMALAS